MYVFKFIVINVKIIVLVIITFFAGKKSLIFSEE